MISHSSTRAIATALALAVTAALAIAAPVRAQGVHVEFNGGTGSPGGPTNGNVDAGVHVGLGISHPLSGTPLTLGLEGSFVSFGETELLYGAGTGCCPACLCLPVTPIPNGPPNSHLDLANYFVTAKYALFTSRVIHPYVALAGGVTQHWAPDNRGSLHGSEFDAGGRAGAGVEGRVGRLGVGLDVSYATVSTLKYEGNLVRYVPVTLRLTF
jgi:hypothetical protein